MLDSYVGRIGGFSICVISLGIPWLVILSFRYVYSTRCSMTLLAVLDLKQNILRLSTLHRKSQRGWPFKIEITTDLKRLHHIMSGPILNSYSPNHIHVCATYIKRNRPCTNGPQTDHKRALNSPFSARLWSVQYPFQARFRAVLLKRSGVKRTVHGRVFLPHTVCHIFSDPITFIQKRVIN